jgi:hypothetical protein
VLSFDWEIVGYNANNDDAKYEIFVDGVSQGESFLVNGGVDSQDGSGTVNFEIPDNTSTISLEISVRNDGGSGYSGFDNFKIEGSYLGNLIYSGGTWTPSAPTALTGTQDALVQDGTYTTSDDVSLNSISVLGDASVEISSTDVLSINAGLYNNGSFTFKSDTSSSAQLADATGVSITGDVTVERYIPAGTNDSRSYRLLTSAVNSTNSINANWQEGVTTEDATPNPNPGFGTHVTGGDATDGFDQNETGNASMFTFDNTFLADQAGETQQDGWSQISNTFTETLEAGKPYLTFIRGDRSVDLSDNTDDATNTTLRATGQLAIGNQSSQEMSDEGESFSLLGNPYQAIVDFTQISFTEGVKDDHLFVWNPDLSTRGGYETITTAADQMIQPGQSFWVQNSQSVTTAPTVEFTEAAKNTSGVVTAVFDEGQIARAKLSLYNSDNLKLDVLQLSFEENANNGLDDFDAGKLINPDENLASLNNDRFMSVERRALPGETDVIPLSTFRYQFTTYEFRLSTDNWDDSIDVFVQDNYLNTTTPIDTEHPFSFSIDTNIPESIADDRFSLVFDNTTLGIDDERFGEDFSLYPNPSTNGRFSIKTPGLSGDVHIEMTNLIGQQVYSQQLSTEAEQVNVNAGRLSSGLYVLKLSQDQKSYNFKLLID